MVRDRFVYPLDSKKKKKERKKETSWSVLIVSFLLKRGSMVFYDYRRFVWNAIHTYANLRIYMYDLLCILMCKKYFDFMAKCNKFYWFVDVLVETYTHISTSYTYTLNIFSINIFNGRDHNKCFSLSLILIWLNRFDTGLRYISTNMRQKLKVIVFVNMLWKLCSRLAPLTRWKCFMGENNWPILITLNT